MSSKTSLATHPATTCLVDPSLLLSKQECAALPHLYEFLSVKGVLSNAKTSHVRFVDGKATAFPVFDESSLQPSASESEEQPRAADLFIVENPDPRLIQLFLTKRIAPENRASFLRFLNAYLHDQPSFDYGDVRHQLAPMPSVLAKQQHVALRYVTAREFDTPFHLSYEDIQNAGKASGSWRLDKTWGPMNPVQRHDSYVSRKPFCPLAVSRTQAAAWFNTENNACWSLGIILLDEPPKFKNLPGQLKPSYHIIAGEFHPDYGSSSHLILQCMRRNPNLQGTAIPSPLVVIQDLYRLIAFEWTHLIAFYTRDLNAIEWALQHGLAYQYNSSDLLGDAMRSLFLSRRRISWYRSLIKDQLTSCQVRGRQVWGAPHIASVASAAVAGDELVEDFKQLEYLMSELHDRMNASMAHITGETNVLDAKRAHELNHMTVQQNKITFAQNKILLALALVGTFFLPINAIAAVFSMGGRWAAGESLFPVFWAICVPTSLGLVAALLVFMRYGAKH